MHNFFPVELDQPWVFCNEIWVHFKAQHVQGVHVTKYDLTATHRLAVVKNDDCLIVAYLDAKNQCRKLLTYNFDAVSDFSCEGVETPPEAK